MKIDYIYSQLHWNEGLSIVFLFLLNLTVNGTANEIFFKVRSSSIRGFFTFHLNKKICAKSFCSRGNASQFAEGIFSALILKKKLKKLNKNIIDAISQCD